MTFITRHTLIGLTGLLIISSISASPAGEVISEAEIRRKAKLFVTQQYANTDAQVTLNWVTSQAEWRPGFDIDSISVRYSRDARPRGQTVLSVEAWRKGRAVRRVSYAVYVEVVQPVLVSLSAVHRGDPIKVAQFTLEKRDITRLKGAPLLHPDDLAGLQARRNIPNNAVVTAAMLEAIPLIERGELVTLHYETEAITLEVQARALQDGASGEMIWCMALAGGKRYRARVEAPDRAQLIP